LAANQCPQMATDPQPAVGQNTGSRRRLNSL